MVDLPRAGRAKRCLTLGPVRSGIMAAGRPERRSTTAGGEGRVVGFEYRLRFSHSGEAAVASTLRRLPGVVEIAEPEGIIEIRASGPATGMPDGRIQPIPDGAYFCDYCRPGSQLLGAVVGALVDDFGAVTVEEWE